MLMDFALCRVFKHSIGMAPRTHTPELALTTEALWGVGIAMLLLVDRLVSPLNDLQSFSVPVALRLSLRAMRDI